MIFFITPKKMLFCLILTIFVCYCFTTEMNDPALYLIPVLLGDTPIEKVIPPTTSVWSPG